MKNYAKIPVAFDGGQVVEMAQQYQQTFSALNFAGIATADVVCLPGQYNQVGVFTVPAQEAVGWGVSQIINGGLTGDALYMAFYNALGVALEGTVRLIVEDANSNNPQTIGQFRTERLRADQNDRTKAILLQLDKRLAKQDSRLVIKFYPDSATSVTIMYNGTSTKIIAPVTIFQ